MVKSPVRKKEKKKANQEDAELEHAKVESDSLGSTDEPGQESKASGHVQPVDNDEISEMKNKIEELEAEVDGLQKINASLQEQMLRVRAEAENFRKRMQREKDEFARFAREGFVRDLLPVKDNLERALIHAGDDPTTIVDGVKLTLEQFDSVFKNMGVESFESLGAPFDPAFHQAMTQVESDEHKPNTVVDELQKGYQLNGRLLRPAMVTVAKAKSAEKG
ncbi:MAG: nucleotide exchange factor GrpE [Pseudomonadota bacterium]|nr:nucleotide exchange factor GrpE [Pseudomonadota bacterium]